TEEQAAPVTRAGSVLGGGHSEPLKLIVDLPLLSIRHGECCFRLADRLRGSLPRSGLGQPRRTSFRSAEDFREGGSPESPPPPRCRSRRTRRRRAGRDCPGQPVLIRPGALLPDQQALCRVAARGVRASRTPLSCPEGANSQFTRRANMKSAQTGALSVNRARKRHSPPLPASRTVSLCYNAGAASHPGPGGCAPR